MTTGIAYGTKISSRERLRQPRGERVEHERRGERDDQLRRDHDDRERGDAQEPLEEERVGERLHVVVDARELRAGRERRGEQAHAERVEQREDQEQREDDQERARRRASPSAGVVASSLDPPLARRAAARRRGGPSVVCGS